MSQINNTTYYYKNNNNIDIYTFLINILYIFIFICFIVSLSIIIIYYCNIYNNKKIQKIKSEKLLICKNFTISYNNTLNSPNYSIHFINRNIHFNFKNKIINSNSYNTDLLYKINIINPIDIKNICSSYNKYNFIHIYPVFYKNIWIKLENYINYHYSEHYIITIPEYSITRYIHNLKGKKIYIPCGFYKLILNKNMELIWNIHLKHEINPTKTFIELGNYDKLPYFFY